MDNNRREAHKPFIKWAGGKERELAIIHSNLPDNFDRYIEPFVGGGAVYFSLNKPNSIINDKSDELISLYKYIKSGNKDFFHHLKNLSKTWLLLEEIIISHKSELENIYFDYCSESEKKTIFSTKLKVKTEDKILEFVVQNAEEFNGLLENNFNVCIDNYLSETKKSFCQKISRMHKIEIERGKLSREDDVINNIETAFKSAFYSHFRFLYNFRNELQISNEFASAIFYFIREHCYASMFRYNTNGKFNVPYGGMSYNKKSFVKKIDYMESSYLKGYMKHTKIYNLDFEVFCNQIDLSKEDFIFLDPPYDTEFSTYTQNAFGEHDQARLADFLKKIKSNFMLIIKNTELINSLYSDSRFRIESFDKKYLVSFKNRNNQNAEHLLIRNY